MSENNNIRIHSVANDWRMNVSSSDDEETVIQPVNLNILENHPNITTRRSEPIVRIEEPFRLEDEEETFRTPQADELPSDESSSEPTRPEYLRNQTQQIQQ